MQNVALLSKLIYTDIEVNGRIYSQLCELNVSEIFDPNTMSVFFEHTFSVMHKLHAALYHFNNYCQLEIAHSIEFEEFFRKHPNERREAFDLIFELEAFLFQIKSSLDMLVKLMIPILAPHKVSTHTFGNKGRELMKGMTQYKLRKDAKIGAADDLISLIEHNQIWLERVVGMRDELSHVRALKNYQFEPIFNTEGETTVRKPAFKGLDTVQFMNEVLSDNLMFHQDFMAVAVSFKAPTIFHLVLLPEDSLKRATFGDTGRFIKWTWSIGI